MSDVVRVEKIDGNIAKLTINRPDKLNALNREVRQGIFGALNNLTEDDDIRVVLITGAGDKAFIAGAISISLKLTRCPCPNMAPEAILNKSEYPI